MSEQNKPNQTTKAAAPATDKAAEWGDKFSGWMAGAAKMLAPIALLLIAIAIGIFAAVNIFDLFQIHLMQPATSAALAVLASVGITYVMIITMKGWKHPSVQAAATLFAVVYVFITFAMVVLKWIFDAAMQDANITVKDVAQNVLKTAPFLRDFGSLFVVALVGVGLACVSVLVATSKNPAEEFEHENRARSHLVGNVVKIIVSLTSIGLVVLFGSEVLKIDILVTVLLAVILDAGMINAYLRAESAARAGDHRQASVWRVWTAIYGGVVALVAIETVSHFAANSASIAPAQKEMLNSGIFNVLKDIGLLALCGAVGLSVVQLVVMLFAYTNQRRDEDIKAGKYEEKPKSNTARLPWMGRATKPAPATAQLAQDGTNPALPAGTTLSAKSVPGGAEWQVTKDGQPVASGKAESLDAAKAAANSAAGSWLGKFVFVFNGESDYDEGGAIKSRADELLGEIGMRVKHGSPIGLEFWMFDKESFTSALKLVNGQPMQVSIGALTAQCSVTGFTRAADGSVTHAEVAADVFWDVAKANMTEAEARKLLEGVIHKQDDELNPKTSENGVKYGTTGSVVDAPAKGWPTPEELAAHRKWVEDNAKKSPRQ